MTFAVGMTDLTIAGRMAQGDARVPVLDAMALGGYVAWFFNILQIAVATGVMALVSRSTGGGDHDLARKGLGQGGWLGCGAGVASMLVLLLGSKALVRFMQLGPEASEHALEYLGIYACSGLFSGPMLAINAALRGSGDTRTPFIGMVVMNGVNILASWLLVLGPEPLGEPTIGRIAAGTVIGWACGLAVVALLVRGDGEALHWTRQALTPCRDTLRRILRVGAPQALEIAGMWGIHAYGVRVISMLPQEGALGAHILAIRVESMSFLPGFAIGTAAAALAGQYLGAGSKEMAVRAVRLCWKLAVLVMSAMGVFFVLGGRQVVEWVAPGSEVHVALASPLFIVCALTQPFFATCIVLKTSMRGAGATAMVIRYSFGSMIFFRIVALWAASQFGLASLLGVWIILGFDLLCQAGIFGRQHFRGKWLDARV